MNQIGIVTGLFFGQVAGLILTGSVSYPWTIPADGRKETFPEDGDT
jgi:hypothetical protein